MDALPVDPPGKQAAIDADAEFDYGDIIPRDWIWEHISHPKPQDGWSVKRIKEAEIYWATQVRLMKDDLERIYHKTTKSMPDGYHILSPKAAICDAERSLPKDIERIFRKNGQTVACQDDKLLDVGARKQAQQQLQIIVFLKMQVKKAAQAKVDISEVENLKISYAQSD